LWDKLSNVLAAAWEASAANPQPQTSYADLLHLAVNQQHDEAAYTYTPLRLVQEQRRRLQDKQKQLQQLRRQQRGTVTRGRIKNKQQQEALQQEAQQLQQRLQEFDRQVNAAELEQLLATAVARMHSVVVHLLGMLPAAAQLQTTAVMQLLRCSIMHKSHGQVLFEFMLDVAAAADDAAAARADDAARAKAAGGADTVATAAALEPASPEQQQQQQQQPPPQQVLDDPQQVLALLETAVQYSNSAAVEVLAECVPAELGLKPSAIMLLARTLVQTQDRAALIAICRL
jgi:septal ring factor EnvC (AmiA/AmiB activator)